MMNVGLKSANRFWDQYSTRVLPIQSRLKKVNREVNNSRFDFVMGSSPVVTFIMNHEDRSYEYLSENTISVLGYTPMEFSKGGIAVGISMVDPSHTEALNNFIIPKLDEHIKNFSGQELLDEVNFSFQYKIRKKDGSAIWVQETMTVIEVDEIGEPVLSLFHLMDISWFKKDEKIDFHINKRQENGSFAPLSIFSYAWPDNEQVLLSEREEEILELIGKGFSSKCIAEELIISIHTVNTHRKNMLKKMGCYNSSELLIQYNKIKQLI